MPVIEVLLEYGAAVNAIGRQGAAAPIVAARTGSADGVAMLLELGADPGVVDEYGKTALEWAEQYGDVKKCDVLRAAIARWGDHDSRRRVGSTIREIVV